MVKGAGDSNPEELENHQATGIKTGRGNEETKGTPYLAKLNVNEGESDLRQPLANFRNLPKADLLFAYYYSGRGPVPVTVTVTSMVSVLPSYVTVIVADNSLVSSTGIKVGSAVTVTVTTPSFSSTSATVG